MSLLDLLRLRWPSVWALAVEIDLRDDGFASQRGGLDKREHVRLGRLRSSSPPLASLWKSGFRPPLLIALAPYKQSPPIEVASPSDAHRLHPLSPSLHEPSPIT